MNKAVLKQLRAQLTRLKDDAAQWVICAINCALSNPAAPIAS